MEWPWYNKYTSSNEISYCKRRKAGQSPVNDDEVSIILPFPIIYWTIRKICMRTRLEYYTPLKKALKKHTLYNKFAAALQPISCRASHGTPWSLHFEFASYEKCASDSPLWHTHELKSISMVNRPRLHADGKPRILILSLRWQWQESYRLWWQHEAPSRALFAARTHSSLSIIYTLCFHLHIAAIQQNPCYLPEGLIQ